MRRPRRGELAAGTLVLDSGAITKVATGDEVARQIWTQLVGAGWRTCIPAVTLAEVTTGRPRHDAATDRLVGQVGELIACDEPLARRAGALRFQVRRAPRIPSAVDAIVAACAQSRAPSVVLTTDPRDFEALLARSERTRVIAV